MTLTIAHYIVPQAHRGQHPHEALLHICHSFSGRVAPGCYQLGAPTDPDMRDSRIRLLKSWFRNATSTLMDNTR
ncbi:MAG: hypothetical protein WBN03_08345, partial [Desulfobacterales bacterium]